jgi:hypothetical protein
VVKKERGLRQIRHLPQSPFKGGFFKISTFGIAFYQCNLSTHLPVWSLWPGLLTLSSPSPDFFYTQHDQINILYIVERLLL